MTSRRDFLKVGLGGSLLLGLGGCAGSPEEGRRDVLAALIPVLLDGALPDKVEPRAKAIQATLAGVEQAMAGLPPATQRDLDRLFALLSLTPTRIALAGVWPDWSLALPREIQEFLERWRHSRFELFRSAYAALHDLILGTWYAQPDAWPAIGYPGPPRLH